MRTISPQQSLPGDRALSGSAWKSWSLLLLSAALATGAARAAAPTLTAVDVGSPSNAGSTTTAADGKITVVGGGSDIWNNSDNFHYAYFKATGDFDYVMKVESLVGNSGDGGWSKVELMARLEDPSSPGVGPQGGDPHISNMTNRKASDTENGAPAGVNHRGPQWRAERDGPSSWTTPNPEYPPNMPDNWIRMERVGSVFYMYTSNDGKTWNMYTPYSPQGWDTAGSWPGGADSTANSYFTEAWPQTIFLGVAVTAHNDGDVSTAVVSNFGPYTPTAPAISEQPPGTLSVAANNKLELSVKATGDPLHYQWMKDGVPVPTNGLGARYTINLAKVSDSGSYTVKVFGGGKSVVSTASVVSVTVDTTPPTITDVHGDGSFTAVFVSYSEPVGDSALTKGNYTVNNGLTVSSVERVTEREVKLVTSKLTEAAAYKLTVSNVQDSASNTIAANTAIDFQASLFGTGFATFERWHNEVEDPGDIATFAGAVADGTIRPPDYTAVVNQFGGPWGARDNYSSRVSGFFIPPTSGDYVFFVASDDQSNLYLSTDDKPANKKMIAQESGWSNQYQWQTVGGGSIVEDKRSDTFASSEWPTPNVITLTAGKRYYIEMLQDEGGGGDGSDATFVKAGAADPSQNAEGMALLGGVIGTYLDPNGASITISQQPQSVSTVANATVTFNLSATGVSKYGTNLVYQWQKAAAGSSTFADIAGATSASYTTPVLGVSNNGEKYRAVVTVAPISKTSDGATLTVTVDNVAPTISGVASDDSFTKVIVKFSEPVTSASAAVAGNYQLSGGTAVSAAALSQDGYAVTLTTAKLSENADYTLTVNNVKDNAGNAVAANSAASFHSWAFTLGKAKYTYWQDIGGGTAVTDLTGNALYPNSPSGYRFVDEFYSPVDWVDNAGAVVSAWVIPSTSGNYVFFACSDDGGALYLSTDDNPANKKLIAQESGWSGAKSWVSVGGTSTVEEKRSDQFTGTQWASGSTISLQAAKRYYLEYVYKEGGGGDSGGATWKLATAADPANGSSDLKGNVIGTYTPVEPATSSLKASLVQGQIVITWDTGTLVSSPTVNGSYNSVAGATSPYTVAPAGGALFYQIQR